jgi:hypothetical protein
MMDLARDAATEQLEQSFTRITGSSLTQLKNWAQATQALFNKTPNDIEVAQRVAIEQAQKQGISPLYAEMIAKRLAQMVDVQSDVESAKPASAKPASAKPAPSRSAPSQKTDAPTLAQSGAASPATPEQQLPIIKRQMRAPVSEKTVAEGQWEVGFIKDRPQSIQTTRKTIEARTKAQAAREQSDILDLPPLNTVASSTVNGAQATGETSPRRTPGYEKRVITLVTAIPVCVVLAVLSFYWLAHIRSSSANSSNAASANQGPEVAAPKATPQLKGQMSPPTGPDNLAPAPANSPQYKQPANHNTENPGPENRSVTRTVQTVPMMSGGRRSGQPVAGQVENIPPRVEQRNVPKPERRNPSKPDIDQ